MIDELFFYEIARSSTNGMSPTKLAGSLSTHRIAHDMPPQQRSKSLGCLDIREVPAFLKAFDLRMRNALVQ